MYITNIILLIIFSALTMVPLYSGYLAITAFVMLWASKLHLVTLLVERLAKNVKTIINEYIGHLYGAALLPNAKKPMLPDLKELDETVVETVYCIVLILFILVV